jgi:hypothetical protein
MFIARFADCKLEPYDCRRFGATAYHRAQAPVERIMVLGGWTEAKTLLHHYVEESFLLPASVVGYYSWLVNDPPLVVSDSVQRVGSAPPIDAARPAKRLRGRPRKNI